MAKQIDFWTLLNLTQEYVSIRLLHPSRVTRENLVETGFLPT